MEITYYMSIAYKIKRGDWCYLLDHKRLVRVWSIDIYGMCAIEGECFGYVHAASLITEDDAVKHFMGIDLMYPKIRATL